MLLADLPEVHRLLDFRHGKLLVDLGTQALNTIHILGEEGDVESSVHAPALQVAVVTNEDEAAAEVEEQEPAIDHAAENFKESALEPAPDSEGQVDQVDGPDEQPSAEGAVPAEQQEEHKIERIVEHSEAEDHEPPGEGDDRNDVHLPEPRSELDGEDEPAGERSALLLGNLTILTTLSVKLGGLAITGDFLPVERDIANFEPVLGVALGAHNFTSGVLVVDPLVTGLVR